jgi:hypothetical protein
MMHGHLLVRTSAALTPSLTGLEYPMLVSAAVHCRHAFPVTQKWFIVGLVSVRVEQADE